MAPHSLLLKSPTGRLQLAPPSEANDTDNARVRCHPVTRKYLRYLPEHVATEDARKLREDRLADQSLLEFHVYRLDKDGREQFVGGTMIFNINEEHNSCELGIILSPEAHGGGLATDAFYTMLSYVFGERKFHRATFETGADNLPMRGWLEKVAGARLESTRKDAWKDPVNGGYSDVTGYAILEDEWRERVRGKLEKKLGL
ncbi:hypothetical protein PQX77_012489 [Marasmius sp. AFHP31]|nr:hypothetical protein PQX77_012489 [Marasmius sp. AFHP31]